MIVTIVPGFVAARSSTYAPRITEPISNRSNVASSGLSPRQKERERMG